VPDVKIAKRPDRCDNIAHLQAMNIGGSGSRKAILPTRWSCNPNIESKLFVDGGIRSHGIISANWNIIRGPKFEHALRFPNICKGCCD
jgi:hypothetical protein